jgi:cytochrome c biogenesis protein CcdA
MIFDDWKSLIHFFVGLAAGIVSLLSPPIAAILIIVFTAYQIVESKSKSELLSDLAEFFAGVTAGCVVSSVWIHVSNISL